jgi:O-antigen/teichoic acid export membrane protein
MSGVARQAVVVSLSRFANYGLMLVSPIVLVRLLSIEDFGRYREFLVYSGVLLSFATFGITTSLLYFIPGRPENTWQFVKHTTHLTAVTSLLVILGLALADSVTHGAIVGHFLAPLIAYTFVFANVDFWEYLWLAKGRPVAVFAYTCGRLLARMTVVIAAAYFWRTVNAIIWSLVALESARLIASFVIWNLVRGDSGESAGGGWRQLMRFCLPNGGSLMLAMMNRYSGNIVVAKIMGPVALAHYTIGTYVEPIIVTLRNSLSDSMLPAMVNRSVTSPQDGVRLWQRGTVVASILLLPIGVVLARYAEILIVTGFSIKYLNAVPILQVFLLVLVRECFDFAIALKAINQTRYFLYGDAAAIVLNLVLIIVLIPVIGLVGAVVAYVISSYAEGIYLGWWVTRLYRVPARHFVPWREVSKVALASALALVVTYRTHWIAHLGLAGVVLGCALYVPLYAWLLQILNVQEARELMGRLRLRIAVYVPLLKTRSGEM